MGDGNPEAVPTRRLRAERSRELTVIYAVMVSILLLILLQFLLLMVAVEHFLSGGRTLLVGAAVGSLACFAGACWLIRYVVGQRPG